MKPSDSTRETGIKWLGFVTLINSRGSSDSPAGRRRVWRRRFGEVTLLQARRIRVAIVAGLNKVVIDLIGSLAQSGRKQSVRRSP